MSRIILYLWILMAVGNCEMAFNRLITRQPQPTQATPKEATTMDQHYERNFYHETIEIKITDIGALKILGICALILAILGCGFCIYIKMGKRQLPKRFIVRQV